MNRMRKIRKLREMTLEDLAGILGSNTRTLSKIERGLSEPSMRMLQRIAEALNVSASELLEPEGFSEPEIAPYNPKFNDRSNYFIDARSLAPAAKAPMAFRTSAAVPSYGFRKGTILVIDNGRAPAPGEVVVVQLIEPGTGKARTRIGQLLGQFLIGSRFSEDPSDHVDLSSVEHTTYGPVVASTWSPPLVESVKSAL